MIHLLELPGLSLAGGLPLQNADAGREVAVAEHFHGTAARMIANGRLFADGFDPQDWAT